MDRGGGWTPPWAGGTRDRLIPAREDVDEKTRAAAAALGASPDAVADAAVRAAARAAAGLGFPALEPHPDRLAGVLAASCVRASDGAVFVAGFGAYDPRGAARSTGAASDRLVDALTELAAERGGGDEPHEALFLVTFSALATRTVARLGARFRRAFVTTAWETLLDPAAHPWVPRHRVLWDPTEEAALARELLGARSWRPRDAERWNLPRLSTTDAVAARALVRHGDLVLVERDAGDENTPSLALRVAVDPALPFLA